MPGAGTASPSLCDLLPSADEALAWMHDWARDLDHNPTIMAKRLLDIA
jgi:hypothetical protein